MRDHRDIGERLMIADDHVDLAGLDVLAAGDVDAPGVDARHGAAQAAETAGRAQPPGVAVEQPDNGQERGP